MIEFGYDGFIDPLKQAALKLEVNYWINQFPSNKKKIQKKKILKFIGLNNTPILKKKKSSTYFGFSHEQWQEKCW